MAYANRGLFGKSTGPLSAFPEPEKPKGLFGRPDGPLSAFPEQQPQPERQKPNVLRGIAGTIGDYLMQQQGMAPVYAPAMLQQQQAAAARSQAELKRAQDLADWKWKEDYQRENPGPQAPDAFERALQGAGIDPQSEQGQQLYRGRAEAMARDPTDEFVVVPVPGGTYAGPRSGLAQAMGQGGAPQAASVAADEWNNAKPMGGAGSNVGGGFPR